MDPELQIDFGEALRHKAEFQKHKQEMEEARKKSRQALYKEIDFEEQRKLLKFLKRYSR